MQWNTGRRFQIGDTPPTLPSTSLSSSVGRWMVIRRNLQTSESSFGETPHPMTRTGILPSHTKIDDFRCP